MRPPPLKLGKKFNQVLSDVKKSCPIIVHDCVFITNNANVYQWASNETFIFRLFKFLHQFYIFSFIFDGFGDINPIWQSVLHVDDILDKKQQIYVKDTLVLHCDSTDAYENVIPFICGPYFRLVLHGNVNVNQVKRLISPNVKKVRINAKMELLEKDYDDFAKFVMKQTSSYSNKCFAICCNKNWTIKLNKKLKETSLRYAALPRDLVAEDSYVISSGHLNCYTKLYFLWLAYFLAIAYLCFFNPFDSDKQKMREYLSHLLLPLLTTAGLIIFGTCGPRTDSFNPSIVQNNGLKGF
uniref:Motile sperm domain-containing protein 1 n=1 Tax=Panagrellus redivivus TaxID=6233 RepID=A0A7E4VID8_PANRE